MTPPTSTLALIALLQLIAAQPPQPCCVLKGDGSMTSSFDAALGTPQTRIGWLGINSATSEVMQFFDADTPALSRTGSYIYTNASGTFIRIWLDGICAPAQNLGPGLDHPRACFGTANDMWSQFIHQSVGGDTYNQTAPSNVVGRMVVGSGCRPAFLYSQTPFVQSGPGMQVYSFVTVTATPPPAEWSKIPAFCS